MRNIHTDYYERMELINSLLEDLQKRVTKTEEQKKAAIDYANEKIKEYKREYRKKLKGKWSDNFLYPGEDCTGYGEIVGCCWRYDSGWRKVFFKGEHWTKEEMQEFIDDNWVEYRPSPYDCTGQLFTCGIDCFNVPSGVVCYIREALDV